MTFNLQANQRRSIRLTGYNYSQNGRYFITICVQDRKCLFGEIVSTVVQKRTISDDGAGMPERATTRGTNTMVLNAAGKMVEQEWQKLPDRFPNIILHEYIIMPNHFHGIIEIVGAPLVGAFSRIPDPQRQENHQFKNGQHQMVGPTVGEIIGAFKSVTTNAYIKGVKNQNWPKFKEKLWQRNFWEHIIRDQRGYQNIAKYIINNPQNWKSDKLKSSV